MRTCWTTSNVTKGVKSSGKHFIRDMTTFFLPKITVEKNCRADLLTSST